MTISTDFRPRMTRAPQSSSKWPAMRRITARLRVSPAAFFQVNLALLPAIQDRMRKFLGEGECLADLYAATTGNDGERVVDFDPANSRD